jgi:hypothetical protein
VPLPEIKGRRVDVRPLIPRPRAQGFPFRSISTGNALHSTRTARCAAGIAPSAMRNSARANLFRD